MDTATQQYIGKEISFTRTFDAPRKLVFACWTDPKHLSAWWGPHHFDTPRVELDARKGGSIRIDMRGPDGTVHFSGGRYEEVLPYERIVFIGSVLDAEGKPIFEVLNTITLAEKDGKTVQTNTARVLTATDSAPQFLKGMQEGWKQSLEKLDAYLRKAAR